MKKVIFLSAVVAGLALASCGGHTEAEVAAADSTAVDSVVVDTTVIVADSAIAVDTAVVK